MEHEEEDLEEGLLDDENCSKEVEPRHEAEEQLLKKREVIEHEEHEEPEEPQSDWAFLPDVCLRQVFWWLCDRDRASAAPVCHHWHQVMRSPWLWRQRTFHFSGHISQRRYSELDKAVDYMRAYGGYLEHLEVFFGYPFSSSVSRRFQETMRTFLATLRKTGSSLRSLAILQMALDHSTWNRRVQNALVRSLTFYLLHGGSQLSFLNLSGAHFNLAQGLQVLEALAAAQQQSGRLPALITLNLNNFFAKKLAVYGTSDFAKVMCRFKRLSSLTLNYRCISDDLLQALASSCAGTKGKGSLHTFTVLCHVEEPHVQVISHDAWALLAQSCPSLKVDMSVDWILAPDRLRCILLGEIPLHALSLTSCFFRDFNWTVKPALANLIPLYRCCLQKLTLDINNVHETVDEELLEVVTVCSKLTYLKVWAFLDISFLDRLLRKCLDKQCALSTIRVQLYTNIHETRVANEMLVDVESRYRQLIDSQLNYCATYCPIN
ncbi:F-box only protein 39-like [Salminus brasiliensis]|uniref:F-box only protein 39-like n=1 Tax=Salminus brasiliensis TaxID=930266 RepID=UPI003B8382F5